MATNCNAENVNENSGNDSTNASVCANNNNNNNNNNCNMITTTTTTPMATAATTTIGTSTLAKYCNNMIHINSSSSSNNNLGINASKSIQIVRPPAIMPPTPTSSPNTHEWSQMHQPNSIQFHMCERFALPYLPPVPHLNNTFVRNGNLELMTNFLHPSTLPSSSHTSKIRLRSWKKLRYSNYSNWKAESNGRKLRTAASTCNMEILTRVLEAGADPNAADEYKRSPLHLAACRGYIPIVQELLQYGANPNVVDSLGNTPLHLAVISASSNNFNVVVRVLLQGGASVHMYDRSNQTPLDLAEAKLRMLRSRYINPIPETAQILEDMCMLTSLILRYMVKQQKELDDLSALEERLQNLSTSDKQEDVVSQTADELLASVERLSITNK